MTDLAGRAVGAVEEVVVDDDPGAHAARDLHEDEAAVAATVALPVLGEGTEVGVVLDLHGRAEDRRGGGPGVDALPAREDRGRLDDVVDHRRRQPEAHVPQRSDARVDPGEDRGREPEPGLVPLRLDAHAFLGQHPPGEVADGHRDVPVSEVDADHDAGARGEPYGGAAPAAAGVDVEQALGGQVAHDVGHRRRRQSR